MFSLCRRLVGHFPVCRSRRVACGVLKRRANSVTKGWDVEEYELTVDVVLVLSNKNMADQLTRVPQRWFTAMKMENGPKPLITAIH